MSKLLKENGYEDLSRKVNDLVREYREQLISIEDAYIDSRYEDYYEEESKELIGVAERIINFLEEVAKNVKLG
nr:HEPN domain-containing protein [Acidianus ambivalens]